MIIGVWVKNNCNSSCLGCECMYLTYYNCNNTHLIARLVEIHTYFGVLLGSNRLSSGLDLPQALLNSRQHFNLNAGTLVDQTLKSFNAASLQRLQSVKNGGQLFIVVQILDAIGLAQLAAILGLERVKNAFFSVAYVLLLFNVVFRG